MNALTKAFVVVVTILAVILVALVVPFAARVPDYAQKYEDIKLAEAAARKQATEAATEARKLAADSGSALELAEQELQDKDAVIAKLQADYSAAQAKLATAETTTARATAALEVANRANEAKDKLLAEYSSLNQDQLATIGELQGRNTDLNQTVIKTRADNARLSNNYLRVQEENKSLLQQLTEQTAQLDSVLKLAEAQGVDLDRSETFVGTPGTAIRGAVTQVDAVTDEMILVQVNVGTRDKVQKGMEFTVYRGDSFVGKIKITTVDTAESVGQLTLGGGVQEGDAIRAGGR